MQNSGSVLGGTGTLAAAVSVTNSGTLNPGNNAGANGSAANAGRLTMGALTLSSTATSVFDLASGTTCDQLVANGNITLAGTLTLNVPAITRPSPPGKSSTSSTPTADCSRARSATSPTGGNTPTAAGPSWRPTPRRTSS